MDSLDTNMSKIKLYIAVRNEFVGFHRYLAAPKEVEFLRDFHRHIFKIKSVFLVEQENREKEFFTIKNAVQKYLDENYKDKYFEKSCESIAKELLEEFGAVQVEVSEDGESDGIASKDWYE